MPGNGFKPDDLVLDRVKMPGRVASVQPDGTVIVVPLGGGEAEAYRPDHLRPLPRELREKLEKIWTRERAPGLCARTDCQRIDGEGKCGAGQIRRDDTGHCRTYQRNRK